MTRQTDFRKAFDFAIRQTNRDFGFRTRSYQSSFNLPRRARRKIARRRARDMERTSRAEGRRGDEAARVH